MIGLQQWMGGIGPLGGLGPRRFGASIVVMASLSACMPQPEGAATAPEGATSTRLVEREIEAPHAFHATESGAWDGRPSLGGVWVGYPNVRDPERVIIRNRENGKFVIGTLFRREREVGGARFQVSSEAAGALGLAAMAATRLEVTALRPESGREAILPPAAAGLDQAEVIAAEMLPAEDAAAAGAPARAEAAEKAAAAERTAKAAPPATEGKPPATDGKAEATPPGSKATAAAKPRTRTSDGATVGRVIRVGTFSVQTNAQSVHDRLLQGGTRPVLKAEQAEAGAVWRVHVPAPGSEAEATRLLDKVRTLGFPDAYLSTR